jgi:hypothetical protein
MGCWQQVRCLDVCGSACVLCEGGVALSCTCLPCVSMCVRVRVDVYADVRVNG